MKTKTFGQILEETRSEIGISERQAANIINVSNSTWSRWERGEAYPENLETLSKICDLLKLNFANMITLIYPGLKKKYQIEFNILECLHMMNVQDAKIILRISKAMLSSKQT